jgi:hypothetical protein
MSKATTVEENGDQFMSNKEPEGLRRQETSVAYSLGFQWLFVAHPAHTVPL